MKLEKLLIATSNKGKLHEFQNYLANSSIQCLSLEKYNISEPKENGNSFQENALLKAKYYCYINQFYRLLQ